MSWTKEEIRKLKRLAAPKNLFFTEIAEKLGKKPQNVRYHARKLGINYRVKDRYGEWNSKHSHLREKVMRYFLSHTWEQTRKKFGLTRSELKSLFTVGYGDPKLSHLRKDRRRKDAWSLHEMLFTLRHSGIREREWIAKKIDRSCARNIKERMQSWNASTKHLNGMPRSWANQLWPGVRFDPIRTQAGPSGMSGRWRLQMIPWHECLSLSKKHKTPPHIKKCIRAMAKYQEFIFQTRSKGWIRRKIKQSLEAI